MNIDVLKSSGPDELPGILLMVCADVFAPIRLIMFTLSYLESEIPRVMKLTRIVPLYKSENKTTPISLIPTTVKIFESLIYDHLVHHVESNNLMSSSQNGFLKK